MESTKKKMSYRNEKFYDNGKFQMKKYYKANRDSILDDCKERNIRKKTCECGTIIQSVQYARHKRTSKHIKLMDKINE